MQTVEKCHLWLWGEFLRVISASVSHFKLITERLWNKPCECFALLRVVLHSSVLLLGNLSWFWAVCKLSLNTAGCGAIFFFFFSEGRLNTMFSLLYESHLKHKVSFPLFTFNVKVISVLGGFQRGRSEAGGWPLSAPVDSKLIDTHCWGGKL